MSSRPSRQEHIFFLWRWAWQSLDFPEGAPFLLVAQHISPGDSVVSVLARDDSNDAPGPGSWWLVAGVLPGGRSYLKDGNVVRSYGSADGLGGGRVNSLRFGSREKVLAATEGGLSRIDDSHIHTLTSRNGLPCDEVNWSMEDDDHNEWQNMPCGLVKIERAEWHAWVDDPRHLVKMTIFDSFDGVGSVGLYAHHASRVTKSPDGKLWFSPFDGVSVIDPQHLPFNAVPPPMHVEQLMADQKTYDLASEPNGHCACPSGSRSGN